MSLYFFLYFLLFFSSPLGRWVPCRNQSDAKTNNLAKILFVSFWIIKDKNTRYLSAIKAFLHKISVVETSL